MNICKCCGRPTASIMRVPWRVPKDDDEMLALLATYEGFKTRQLDPGALGWWIANRSWEEVHEMRMTFFRAWRRMTDTGLVTMAANAIVRLAHRHGVERSEETRVLLGHAMGLTAGAEGR